MNTTPMPCFIYEHPLNERIRLLMRLESLFLQMKQFHQNYDYYGVQWFFDALFDVLDFLHRYEIRSELIKELQSYKTAIERQSFMMHHDEEMLQSAMMRIDESIRQIYGLNLNTLVNFRENELLNSLRQRNFNQSGNCLFEVPAFQYWLNQTQGKQSAFLVDCYQYFQPIMECVLLILQLVREEATCEAVESEEGMLLRNLDTKKRNQMIRIHLPESNDVFPRISGDRHRVAIRFMRQENWEERAKQMNDKISFYLQICTL
ncbi:MAG: cell division protein ZapD [Cardiobacteriaceae bacterium]|nr:cell division protein ZapD [Cardiobacteriaceae bacterium]